MTISKILTDFREKSKNLWHLQAMLDAENKPLAESIEQFLQSSLEQFAGYLMEGVPWDEEDCRCIATGMSNPPSVVHHYCNKQRHLLKQRIEEAGIVMKE